MLGPISWRATGPTASQPLAIPPAAGSASTTRSNAPSAPAAPASAPSAPSAPTGLAGSPILSAVAPLPHYSYSFSSPHASFGFQSGLSSIKTQHFSGHSGWRPVQVYDFTRYRHKM